MHYPSWLKVNVAKARNNREMRKQLPAGLHTVCESALCPNRGECFQHGTVTFMILGNTCSRRCTFCAVDKKACEPINPQEPQELANAAAQLQLEHVVITSVTRDDLPDQGATHWANVITAVKDNLPTATIEVLTPDFQGQSHLLDIVLATKPHVFNHNIETIERLYPSLRPQALYQRSLDVLAYAKKNSSSKIKSGLMLGLGETPAEIHKVLQDLKQSGCDIVTIGQYIAPSKKHAEVKEFITPEQFTEYKKYGESIGIRYVFSAPLVRSSYMAKEALQAVRITPSEVCL